MALLLLRLGFIHGKRGKIMKVTKLDIFILVIWVVGYGAAITAEIQGQRWHPLTTALTQAGTGCFYCLWLMDRGE